MYKSAFVYEKYVEMKTTYDLYSPSCLFMIQKKKKQKKIETF